VRSPRSVVVDTAAERAAASAPIVMPQAVAPAAPALTHMAVMGFARLHGIKLTTKEAQDHGRQLSARSRELKIELLNEPHPVFGTVHLYTIALLEEHFKVKS